MPYIQHIFHRAQDAFGGYSIGESLSEAEKTDGMTDGERLSIQERRLSALLAECFENVEAYRPYRSLRNKAKDRPFEVLDELPAITRGVYRKNPEMYFNPGLNPGQLARGGTRMTAGYSYPVDKNARSADIASHILTYSRLGLTYAAKHISIRGRLPERGPVSGAVRAMKSAAARGESDLIGCCINAGMLKKYAARLADPKLGYCSGTPSVINALAVLLERNGIPVVPSYKGIMTSGETLLDYERETIRRVFGAPVYASYSTPDDGLIACECASGTLHVIDECFIAEEIGGKIAVTNLCNRAAPRMRYVTDEAGTVADGPCECGRGGKRIILSEDGKSPLYTAPDGRVIPGGVFDDAAGRYYNIVRYKLTQPDPERAELSVELRTSVAADEAAALHRRICAMMPGTLVNLRSNVAR